MQRIKNYVLDQIADVMGSSVENFIFINNDIRINNYFFILSYK